MGKFVNKTALVYNILPNKSAFAISEDDEAIFIHANALARDNLQLNQWYELKCYKNVPSLKSRPTDCEWQSIGLVRRVDPPSDRSDTKSEKVLPAEQSSKRNTSIPDTSMDERILWLFKQPEHSYAQTGGEIAEKLGVGEIEINQTLSRMRRERIVSKASVECGNNNKAASYILWALDDAWFRRN